MTDFDLLSEHSRWLQAFQADNEKCQRQLQAITPPAGQLWTIPQMQQIIQQQQMWHDSLLGHYGQHAQRFQRQDLHGLAQALAHVLEDLREANKTLYETIGDRQRKQAEIQAYQQQTNLYIQDLQNRAFHEQKAAWDRQNARWSASFHGQPQPGQFCSRCGSALHGYVGSNCPFCGGMR
jgi:hypothetical protein